MQERENKFYILPARPRDARVSVLKHDDTFAVLDRFGDIREEHGLFHEDTRFVSGWVLRVEAEAPLLLSSMVQDGGTVMTVNLTNPDMVLEDGVQLARGTLHLARQKFLWNGALHERLHVFHYGERAIVLKLRIALDADFADIFEVRGTPRASRGRVLEPVLEGHSVSIRYESLDRYSRALRVTCSEEPTQVRRHEIEFALALAPGHERDLYLSLACESGPSRGVSVVTRTSYDRALGELDAKQQRARSGHCQITTSSARFNEFLQRSLSDLSLMTTDTPQGPYPYAGVPWFSTAFGRDGLITALETLWLDPSLAAGVLRYLSVTQSDTTDPTRAAEPGKILHETRKGEMANLGDVPFGHYYGSVDATPLFVLLLGAYYEATADRGLVEEIWPHAERALHWMENFGDRDGDGFLEYTSDPGGLTHQGWKDSSDSVFHADGSDARGPIALCEVQAYAYAAYRHASMLAQLLGRRSRAMHLEGLAQSLKERFESQFWCEELGTYAIALDGDKRPCQVRASNAGHCLFSGIASPERAAVLAKTLFDERCFSGWGVRTLARGEARYNPMAYHNGSIWPHDNALIGAGLANYGFRHEALRILLGLFESTLSFETSRLPELFCGFPRMPGAGPTVYPVACSPQAWASGAPLMLLKACLGLTIDAPNRRVQFSHPVLPSFLQELSIQKLRVGDSTVDLSVHRYPEDVGINVLRRSGPMVEVVNIK
jgi:glycogen debranching enzyme